MNRFPPTSFLHARRHVRATLRRWRGAALAVCLVLGAGVGAGRAQTPVVTALSRYTGQPGDTVAITGANFSPAAGDNVVSFGATHGTVLAASAGQLQVQVPAGATFAPVTVRVASGKTAASARPFVPVFAPAGTIASRSFGQMSFGPSTAPTPVIVPVNGAGTMVNATIIDLDGDGKPDIATLGRNSPYVYALRNTFAPGALATSSFAAATSFSTASPRALGMTYGDLNGDGKPDLVVSNQVYASGIGANVQYGPAVSILQNSSTPGTISFLPAVSLARPANYSSLSLYSVKVVDVDGDGWPDIVCSGDALVVYRNLGTGGTLSTSSFAAGVVFYASSDTSDLVVADVDGDGKPDLVLAGNSQLTVLRNTATPGVINANSFAFVSIPTPDAVVSVAAADLDDDGKPELLAGLTDDTLCVFPNQTTPGSLSAASFGTRVDVHQSSSGLAHLAVADLNGDGWPEVLGSGDYGGATLFINDGAGNIAAPFDALVTVNTGSGSNYTRAAVGDLNGNGKPDLVLDGQTGSIVLSENFTVPLTINSLLAIPISSALKIPWYHTTACSAYELLSDNSTRDAGIATTWTSSSPPVATVDARGLVTAVAPGTTTIRAVANGRTAQANLTVQPTVFGPKPGNPDGGFLPTVADGGGYGTVSALAVQADGKTVIGGLFTTVNGVVRNNLARLNDDGSLDPTFDPGSGPDGAVGAVALDSTGRVLIGGSFANVGGMARRSAARVRADGSLDTSFNANITYASSYVNTIGVRPDGRVLLGGYGLNVTGNSYLALLQVGDTGAQDTTFTYGLNTSGAIQTLALQPDGDVLIGGSFYISPNYYDVERLLPTGAVDPNFQTVVKSGSVYGFALQPDGKIVLCGDFSTPASTDLVSVARLNADGTPDSGFVVPKGTFATYAYAYALTRQRNGKIVVSHDLNTVRLNTDGSVDAIYDNSVSPDWQVKALAVGANEKIWEAGGGTAVGGAPTLGVARLQGDVSSFQNWQSRYFSQAQLANDPAHTGANGDVVGDGVPNLLKYALGLDATQSAVGVLPAASLAATNAANPGTGEDFTFRERLQASDLSYQVGVSSDLQSWDYSGSGLSMVGAPTANADGLTQNVTVRLAPPAGGGSGRVFFRLRTSLQP